jgi:hypothetical protein
VLRGLRRRDLLILIGLWLAAGALICGAAAWFLASRSPGQTGFGVAASTPSPVPTYTVQFVEVTARRLYPAAETLARSWEADVQLVGANASWSGTALNLIGDPTDWSFRFYSPSRQRLYLAGVANNGQAAGAPHFQKESSPPSAIDLDKWEVDSPEALARWLDYGGGELLSRDPGVDVTIQLGVDPASGGVAWIITAFDSATGRPVALKVNAATGQASAWQP